MALADSKLFSGAPDGAFKNPASTTKIDGGKTKSIEISGSKENPSNTASSKALAQQQSSLRSTEGSLIGDIFPAAGILSYAYTDFNAGLTSKTGANAGQKTKFEIREDTSFLSGGAGDTTAKIGVVASRSLFNNYSVFSYNKNESPSNFRNDNANSASIGALNVAQDRQPTTENLVEHFDKTAIGEPYYWTDFIYCKWFRKIQNNHLITLRRYPVPIIDNPSEYKQVNKSNVLIPIAQAVTWSGEETGNKLTELLGFDVNLNWREIKSEINVVEGQEKGGNPIVAFLKGGKNSSEVKALSDIQEAQIQRSDYAEPFSNKLFGKLNVIQNLMARDRGLTFNQKFSIKFHYNLRSFDNINPKIAMLDCIANILSLTYNNGSFWGGTNRYFPKPNNGGFVGDQDSLYSGDFTKYFDATKQDFEKVSKGMGNFFKDLMKDPLKALAGLGEEAGNFALGNKLAESRPKLVGFPALLTGAPTGEWHLVIGDPFNPTLTIGNLICKKCKFDFSDQVGADNFPDEMTVTIDLEHARSRDKGDVESMFNSGRGRMYYSLLNDDSSTIKPKKGSAGEKYFNNKGDIRKALGLSTGYAESKLNNLDKVYKLLTT